jgi:hypothetical protein
MEKSLCLKATQADDPWLLFLTREYVGKVCFLDNIAERHKFYCACNIAYWTSTKNRFANWETTLEPIQIEALGEFFVADEDVLVGPKGIRLTKSKVLLGYILAQYMGPTRSRLVLSALICTLKTQWKSWKPTSSNCNNASPLQNSHSEMPPPFPRIPSLKLYLNPDFQNAEFQTKTITLTFNPKKQQPGLDPVRRRASATPLGPTQMPVVGGISQSDGS